MIEEGEGCEDRRGTITMSKVKWVRLLGEGSSSKVHLVSTPGGTVALKVLRRELSTDEGVLKLMSEERSLLEACGDGSRFVVQYLGSLGPLVVALEPCMGGDLWAAMQRLGGSLEEGAALFYTACVIEGLSYLTSRGVLYRDLKPENLLLDGQTGYLKLADLGFSRLLAPGEVATTIVGTAEYLAPEMLRGEGYDHRALLWCLGCLIHEMIAGHPPFLAEDQRTLFSLIGGGLGGVELPPSLGPRPGELVRMLCRLKPAQRPGLDMVTRFSWFSGFDWDGLRGGQVEAPLVPGEAEDPPTTPDYLPEFEPFLDF